MTWVTWRAEVGRGWGWTGAGLGRRTGAGRGPGLDGRPGLDGAGRRLDGPGTRLRLALAHSEESSGKLEAEPSSREHLTGRWLSIPVGRAGSAAPSETDEAEGTEPARKTTATM